MKKKAATLINQQNGALAFKIFSFESDTYFDHIQRHNYYSIILIHSGEIELQIELVKYKISSSVIICISPYQPYSIKSSNALIGISLNFHSDFFCTYKHQNEIQTEGVLFHNIFQPTFFSVTDEAPLLNILNQMKIEMRQEVIGQHQQLVSYLKIFLISILRIKKKPADTLQINTNNKPQIIQDLTSNIELHYQQKHSAIDYAELLNVSTSTLGKLVRKHFGKTLTKLIAERIIVEAKRELYLTSKSMKEISFLLGYKDEYYFSRFFKKQVGISPTVYRNTVGFAKQEN
jgi:AraC family transcriptional activator of pobA